MTAQVFLYGQPAINPDVTIRTLKALREGDLLSLMYKNSSFSFRYVTMTSEWSEQVLYCYTVLHLFQEY